MSMENVSTRELDKSNVRHVDVSVYHYKMLIIICLARGTSYNGFYQPQNDF